MVPGNRLVEAPGARHFFDGRRVVSIFGDDQICAAVTAVVQAPDELPDSNEPGASLLTIQGNDLAAEVVHLLRRLDLTRGNDADSRGPVDCSVERQTAARFASALTSGWLSPGRTGAQLEASRVLVVGPGAPQCVTMMRASGLRADELTELDDIGELDPDRDVVVALANDDMPTTSLLTVDATCRAAAIPWLPVGAYNGAISRVGPLMIPGQTACFDCLVTRLAGNVEFASLYRDVADAPAADTPQALRDWALSIATLILIRWVANSDASIPGTLFTLLPDVAEIRSAHVFPIPRCRTCGAADFLPAAAPWESAGAY